MTQQYVDVATMVEISTPQGLFAIPHVLRDADIRAVPDLTAELRRVKHDPSASFSGRWLERAAPAATRIPGTLSAMYAVMARSVAARQRVGAVAVTAVGMFAGGAGFGITPLTLMSLEVIVGGMSQRPRAIDGQVTVRDVLDLTLAIDHNVVDGAPAARFAAEFRALLESAAVLSPSTEPDDTRPVAVLARRARVQEKHQSRWPVALELQVHHQLPLVAVLPAASSAATASAPSSIIQVSGASGRNACRAVLSSDFAASDSRGSPPDSLRMSSR